MTLRYDLIGDVATVLRAALRAAGAPSSALDGLRVMPARSGMALLVTNANRLLPDPGLWCAPLALPVLGLAQTDSPAATVQIAASAVRRAVMDLPASVPVAPFPPGIVLACACSDAATLNRLRVRAALDAAALTDGPDWPENPAIPDDCLPILRVLLGAARESGVPSAGWTARLLAAFDALWRQGPGPVMRLIDPDRPAATMARLALAARAAALM